MPEVSSFCCIIPLTYRNSLSHPESASGRAQRTPVNASEFSSVPYFHASSEGRETSRHCSQCYDVLLLHKSRLIVACYTSIISSRNVVSLDTFKASTLTSNDYVPVQPSIHTASMAEATPPGSLPASCKADICIHPVRSLSQPKHLISCCAISSIQLQTQHQWNITLRHTSLRGSGKEIH